MKHVDMSPLEGIRGACSIVIVAGHFFTYWAPVGGNVDGTSVPQLGIEYLSSVTLFFVISGFTLTRIYDKSEDGRVEGPGDGSAIDTRTFWRRRVARLAPLYYAGLALGLGPLLTYFSVSDIALTIPIASLWLQSLTVVGNNLDPPLWTVSAFALSYAVFPWILSRLKRLGNGALVCTIGGLTIFSTAFMVVAMGTVGVAVGILVHIFGPLRIPQFACGVAAGLLSKRWGALSRPTLLAEGCTALLLLNLAAGVAVTEVGRKLGPGASIGLWAYYSYTAECVLAPVHAAWVIALCSPGCGGPSKWILTTRPLALLGRLSYALYCVHWPVLFYCAFVVAGGMSAERVPTLTLNGANGWFIFHAWALAPLLALCLAIAAVLHFVLEGPARAAIAGRRAPEVQGVKAGEAKATEGAPSGEESARERLLDAGQPQ